MHILTAEQYKHVDPLLQAHVANHLFCAGVLSGKYAGVVAVDNVVSPRSAVVVKDQLWFYLGGDPNNPAFIEALSAGLVDRQLVQANAFAAIFHIDSAEWLPALSKLVPERDPVSTPRYLYVAEALGVTSAELPADYSLHPINDKLTAIDKLPDDVRNVLSLQSKNSAAAFGTVALHDETWAAWAVVDTIVGTHGEIRLATADTHRRKGLGMAVSAETIRQAFAHGLTAIHWDVIAYNVPSIHIAKKLGLRLAHEYKQHSLIFNDVSYVANVAWTQLDDGAFAQTLQTCERVLSLEKGGMYGHFLSGAALAGLGQAEEAFRHLNLAVEHGWDDVGELEHCEPLKELREMAAWGALIGRIKH